MSKIRFSLRFLSVLCLWGALATIALQQYWSLLELQAQRNSLQNRHWQQRNRLASETRRQSARLHEIEFLQDSIRHQQQLDTQLSDLIAKHKADSSNE